MWFDHLPKANNLGTTVYLIHNGSTHHKKRMKHFSSELKDSGVERVHLVSSKGREGSKITALYGHYDIPGVVIVRQNKQVAHSWFDFRLPQAEEVNHLVQQVG